MPSTLATLDVLVLDGQSTGASPAHGHLLELGWAWTNAAKPDDLTLPVMATLLALPPDATIPRPVSRLTGIRAEDVAEAEEPVSAWERLCTDAMRDGRAPPMVIHYARFELPFLRALHASARGEEPFPFSPICTHRIAQRLLPDLPRRGLRALAGYLGHGVDDLKRSTEHVRATALVWRHLVERLEHEHGVQTLEQLESWLERAAPRRSARRAYPMARDKRLALPDAPGVYRMCRSDGSVLYVGKATSLRSRVNSYFRKHRRVPDRTLEMLTQARDLDVTVTATALEAALLESDQIKAHAPPYNVMLRGGGPGPWYASADLRSFAPHFDRRHRIGPLGGRSTLEAWSALTRCAPGRVPDCAWDELRRTAEPPSAEIWREGWSEFVQRVERAPAVWTVARLARLGALLWRAQRDASEDERPNDEPDEISEAPEDDVSQWDPPRVVAFLERLVLHGAHDLRRARWLTQLGTACVVWTRRDGDMRRTLRLDGGRIIDRGDLTPDDPVPMAPGWGSASLVPATFDTATFDRLRVLTAELRRLVAEGRVVQLYRSPRSISSTERVRRSLRWI